MNENQIDESKKANLLMTTKALLPMALFAIILVFIVGVARKEACSTAVGSVDFLGTIYSPCDLVGTAVGITIAAIISAVSLIVVHQQKLRLIIACLSIIVFIAILFGGFSSIS